MKMDTKVLRFDAYESIHLTAGLEVLLASDLASCFLSLLTLPIDLYVGELLIVMKSSVPGLHAWDIGDKHLPVVFWQWRTGDVVDVEPEA
jgi:hypothetical protein